MLRSGLYATCSKVCGTYVCRLEAVAQGADSEADAVEKIRGPQASDECVQVDPGREMLVCVLLRGWLWGLLEFAKRAP